MTFKQVMFVVLSAALCVTCLADPSLTAEQMLHAIVGTYHCVDNDGTGHTTMYTSVNEVYGPWVHLVVTTPAQGGAAGDTNNAFVGYDRTAKRWDIVGADNQGYYYTRSSHSAHFNGSRWHNDYPADGGIAIIRTFGSKRYTFDLTTPNGKGASVREHAVCIRS